MATRKKTAKPNGLKALAVLRRVLPYAVSRAEDMSDNVQSINPKARATLEEAKQLRDDAWTAVREAQALLGELHMVAGCRHVDVGPPEEQEVEQVGDDEAEFWTVYERDGVRWRALEDFATRAEADAHRASLCETGGT